MLGKISETQHFDNDDRFVNTTHDSGYSVPNFTKISEAYGIKSIALKSYDKLNEVHDWIHDDEPCLFDILLPEDSLLTPKIRFETGKIRPTLDQEVMDRVMSILNG